MSEESIADDAETIVALERAALDRWMRGDPDGFLELSDPAVTYFDPFVARRVDGGGALARLYDGVRGKVTVERYELVDPRVQLFGGVAVLTFQLVSEGGEGALRWNATEVYRRAGTGWRITHTHWSLAEAGLAGGGATTDRAGEA